MEMENKMQGLGIGRVVHYVAYGTPKNEFPQGVHRAAIVTEIEDKEKGIVTLCVLNPTGMFFNSHLEFDKTALRPGTWHWPEKVD